MEEAIFIHGDPRMIDYTAGGNIAAGEVVVIQSLPYVAHLPIANGDLGALAAEGGVYEMVKLGGGEGPDIVNGEDIFFSEADNIVTNESAGNVHFGTSLQAAGVNAESVRVLHRPIADIAEAT